MGQTKFGLKILIKINHGLQKLCPIKFVKIRSVTAKIFLIWTNVARTNVARDRKNIFWLVTKLFLDKIGCEILITVLFHPTVVFGAFWIGCSILNN